jgi:hypothetical protein
MRPGLSIAPGAGVCRLSFDKAHPSTGGRVDQDVRGGYVQVVTLAFPKLWGHLPRGTGPFSIEPPSGHRGWRRGTSPGCNNPIQNDPPALTMARRPTMSVPTTRRSADWV